MPATQQQHEPRWRLVRMAAEPSRADVGVPRTAAHWRVRSRENGIKRRGEGSPGTKKWMGGIQENSDVVDYVGTEQTWINQGSRSPAAATGLWSFVCAPFIHHLCFLGNRGLPAGTKQLPQPAPNQHHSPQPLFHLKGNSVTELKAYMLYFNMAYISHTHARDALFLLSKRSTVIL